MAFPEAQVDQNPSNQSDLEPDTGKKFYDFLVAYVELSRQAIDGDQEAKAIIAIVDENQRVGLENSQLELEIAQRKVQIESIAGIAKLMTGRKD